MINSTAKKKIIKILGATYTGVILQYFEENDIKLPNGDPYTADYIRVVMNGQNNDRLETEIYNAVAFVKAQQADELQRRENILNKKSDAVTSD